MQSVGLIIYVDIYVNIYDKRSMCNLNKWEKHCSVQKENLLTVEVLSNITGKFT